MFLAEEDTLTGLEWLVWGWDWFFRFFTAPGFLRMARRLGVFIFVFIWLFPPGRSLFASVARGGELGYASEVSILCKISKRS